MKLSNARLWAIWKPVMLSHGGVGGTLGGKKLGGNDVFCALGHFYQMQGIDEPTIHGDNDGTGLPATIQHCACNIYTAWDRGWNAAMEDEDPRIAATQAVEDALREVGFFDDHRVYTIARDELPGNLADMLDNLTPEEVEEIEAIDNEPPLALTWQDLVNRNLIPKYCPA